MLRLFKHQRSFAKKINRKDFLQRELTENPEFFNAFPHLAPEGEAFLKNRDYLDGKTDTTGEVQNEGYTFNPEKKDFSRLRLKEEPRKRRDETRVDFFNSLEHHYTGNHLKSETEMMRDNEIKHVDAYTTIEGPKKYLTQEERDSIHNEIDIKME